MSAVRSIAFLCFAGLAASAVACGGKRAGPTAPGVLLIVVDGLRADHLGVYGYDRDTSPTLSSLAAEGVRFTEALASAPLLVPAHVALLTGCEPVLARRFLPSNYDGPSERRWNVPERGAHLAVEFLAAGYATAAFLDDEELGREQGFALGFQRYEVLDEAGRESWEGRQTNRIFSHFLQWLRELPPERPWFAYLHLAQLERCWSEPAPSSEAYFQPRPTLSEVPPVASTDSVFFAVPRSRWRGGARTLGQYEAQYDDQIRAIDQELAGLCGNLRRMGRFDSSSLHVVGSFGMQLGEAGLYLCSGRYSGADLGVPWIFRPRAGLDGARGRSVSGLVSTLDVGPTLLALEGLAVPRPMTGLSQAAVARDPLAPVAERRFVYASCGLQGGCAVIGAERVLEYLLQPRAGAGRALLAPEEHVVSDEPAGDALLRRSWFGEWSEFERRLGISFYERARMGSPPLETEVVPGAEQQFGGFKDEAVRWRNETNDARHYLQAPPGRSGLDAAALEALRRRGYGEDEP